MLPILFKMAITAVVVVAASVAAERAGPRVGGIIVALPVSAGPAYVFLALQAPAAFVAESALFSFASIAASVAFIVAFRFAAPRCGALASIAAATAAWFAVAAATGRADPGLGGALLLNAAAFGIGWALTGAEGGRATPTPRALEVSDLAARALMTASLVAGIVTLSAAIGPVATGMALFYPVVLTGVGWVMHRRYGGEAAAATLSATLVPLLGIAGFLLTVHLAVESLGAPAALAAGFAVSLGWSALLLAVRLAPGAAPRGG